MEHKGFDNITHAVSQDILLLYPDFNKCFYIHTDARDYQLGAVISQNSKPIAFYSRKLKGQQTQYTVIEK